MSKKDQILKWVKYFSNIALNTHFKKEIKAINNQILTKELSLQQKREIKDYFSNFGFSHINTDWHKFYLRIHSKFNKKYIPKDIFYSKIEPALNRTSMYPAYLDKNLMSKLFVFVKQPKTIIKNISGFYYSNQDELIDLLKAVDICSQFSKFVIKPSINSGGGRNVRLFKNIISEEVGYENSIRDLLNSYRKDFIVQEVVVQNEKMSLLNDSSINTLRIMSFLKGKKVQIISSVVRVGRLGRFTDNNSSGGISCGIISNGILKKIGYSEIGKIHYNTDNGCVFDSFRIPNYNKIIFAVKKMHEVMPNFRLISWDLAIDNTNNIVLIEFNLEFQGIDIHQLNNGPLFGNLTEDILNEVMS